MGLSGPLMLVAARVRRRPWSWLLPVVGVALAAAFVAALAGEATITADKAARSTLAALRPLDRAVRVTWQGPASASVRKQARALLDSVGLPDQTQVTMLNPVRLSGVVVRPVGIAPLGQWSSSPPPARCSPRGCPVLLAGGNVRASVLSAPGVRLTITGRTRLSSAVPLGFLPQSAGGQPPLLVSSDPPALDTMAALSGLYRTNSWVAEPRASGLHSWQLAGVEDRLRRAQAELETSGSQFSLSGPFAGLDAARAQADAAPQRLLLAGGGGAAALLLFIVLAAGGLRRDQAEQLLRLRMAGARTYQCVAYVLLEAAWLSAVALLAGAGLAIAATAVLAHAVGQPAGGVLAHSLLTAGAAIGLAGGWLCATALIAAISLAARRVIADVLALAAAVAIALALARGSSGSDPLPVLLAPLACLAGGVLVLRAAGFALRAGERATRRGPVLLRLALVDLARAPSAPSLAIAFIAVSTGLGAFALAYRATLLRGAADQAAQSVPLDATVSPGPDFTTPLELASLGRWRALAGAGGEGGVFAVRRTDASYLAGSGTVTVPALGVPAAALTRMHGWRASDGSAPLRTLAGRLVPSGPVRLAGPVLPAGVRRLALAISSPSLAVAVTADLRGADGSLRQLPLGQAGAGPGTLSARVPAGRWELEALELDEPAGLQATNGHQNAENPAAATQFTTTVRLGPLVAGSSARGAALTVPLAGWRGVGAAVAGGAPQGGGAGPRAVAVVRFSETGQPGIVRPLQPSDYRPVPVLTDPQSAAAAGRDGRLALTIDGLPVPARVVGVLARFPSLDGGAAGFVVADEATLASALDASLPGQGRPDELWIATPRPGRLRAALQSGPLSQLGVQFRADLERQLRNAPIARGVLGVLIAAAIVAAVLALVGLVVAMLGAARDRRVEGDLVAQGVGPRALTRELRVRMTIAGVLGVIAGLLIGLVLTLLAVGGVQASWTVAAPNPPLIAVTPAAELFAWVAGGAALVAIVAWLAGTTVSVRRTAA